MADPPIIGPVDPPAPSAAAVQPTAALPGSVTLYDPKTSAPVVVDSERAHAAILSGQLNYAPGTRVPVRIAGKIGTVDADELGDAVAKYGATSVSSKAYHEHELQKDFGSTPQAALALGVNTLDSATLGLSNAAIGGVGGKGTREYLRNVTEANPTAATAGDVLGFVAPIAADVLSGGTLTPGIAAAETARLAERGIVRAAEKSVARTALEGAGSALLAPTRAVSAIGDIAEGAAKAVVGSGAEGAAARTAQAILAGGTRGAIEGGFYNVGAEVGRQYLQDDPELTGEALASAWVHGALLGGALGGAFHGVGGLMKRKAPSAFGLAEESGLKAEARAVSSETKALGETGSEAAAVAEAAEHGPATQSGAANRAADAILSQVDDPGVRATLKKAWDTRGPHGFAKDSDALLGDATRQITRDLDTTLKAGHEVDMASFGESKSNQMANLVPKENLRPARDAVTRVVTDAQKVVSDLDSLAAKGGGEGSVKRLGKWLKDFRSVPADQWNDPAQLFDKIDDFKRIVGKEAAFGTSPLGRTDAARDFEGLYERIRVALEDESTWGAAAVAQRDVNAATSEMLGTSRRFESSYTVRYGDKAGVPMYRANPSTIDSFVNAIGKPANDLNAEMFADRVAHRRQFLDAVEKNYSFPPEVKRAIAAERKALDSMQSTIAKTSTDVEQINRLKGILADEKGHGIGGLVGMAIDAVSKPGASLARLAELEATKNRALAKIDKGLGSLRSALRGGERRKPGLAPASDSADSYEKRRASVLAAASRPDEAHAHLQGAAAPIAPHAPATANAMMRAGLRTIQYLMTELPKPPMARADSLTPHLDMEAWQPSDQQKTQYARKYDMATDPFRALHLVADGTITAQHVEALEVANAAALAKMRDDVHAALKAQKKPVPMHMQAPLKTFLGIPQMDPGMQRLMRESYAATQAQAHGQKGSTSLKRPLKLADTTTLNATKE